MSIWEKLFGQRKYGIKVCFLAKGSDVWHTVCTDRKFFEDDVDETIAEMRASAQNLYIDGTSGHLKVKHTHIQPSDCTAIVIEKF